MMFSVVDEGDARRSERRAKVNGSAVETDVHAPLVAVVVGAPHLVDVGVFDVVVDAVGAVDELADQ
jgi:hypothetical protein